MIANDMVLGTAQLGLAYGMFGNSSPMDDNRKREILELAKDRGVSKLDTAQAYGSIEEEIIPLGFDEVFSVISKIPPIPQVGSPVEITNAVARLIERSASRLQGNLDTLLFHDSKHLLSPHGDRIWEAARRQTESMGIRLGFSCYDHVEASTLVSRYGPDALQLPGNVFDQNVKRIADQIRSCDVYLRSVFLQGLLIADFESGYSRLPIAAAALKKWHKWCRQKNTTALIGAISIARGLCNGAKIVVGADNKMQLNEILNAYEGSSPDFAPELAVNEPSIIDPRVW